MDSYRVYVKYNMKLKNIESWVPCLTKYYVKITSEGKYVIYFSALDNSEVEFINLADKNEEIQKLKQEVNKSMSDILEKDATFKQYYQKMQKEIKAAANGENASASPAASAANGGTAVPSTAPSTSTVPSTAPSTAASSVPSASNAPAAN